MIEINYYKASDVRGNERTEPQPMVSMLGHVPSLGDEIVLGAPWSAAKVWHVVLVRRFHWFDTVEARYMHAANVYLEGGCQ